MRYVAAYLLATMGASGEPSAAAVEILKSVGFDVHSSQVQKVVIELKGNDLVELIGQGLEKLSSVPSGGAVAVGSGGAAAGGAALAEEAKKEEKKEESEESDDDMGFGLFD